MCDDDLSKIKTQKMNPDEWDQAGQFVGRLVSWLGKILDPSCKDGKKK